MSISRAKGLMVVLANLTVPYVASELYDASPYALEMVVLCNTHVVHVAWISGRCEVFLALVGAEGSVLDSS